MAQSKRPMCGSCKRSGIYNVPATVEFSGWRYAGPWSEKKVNIHAKYCADHFYCFKQDGGTVVRQRSI